MSGNPFADSVVHLDEAHLDTVLAALGDALAYRKERAGGYCAACEREYAGLCYEHVGDEEAADAYAVLAVELRQEAAR